VKNRGQENTFQTGVLRRCKQGGDVPCNLYDLIVEKYLHDYYLFDKEWGNQESHLLKTAGLTYEEEVLDQKSEEDISVYIYDNSWSSTSNAYI
jgi:hypothetical protein